jgi:hypothetical protein
VEQRQKILIFSVAGKLPGVTKFSNSMSSEIDEFGRTKAPVEISAMLGVEGEDGFEAKTTLAK